MRTRRNQSLLAFALLSLGLAAACNDSPSAPPAEALQGTVGPAAATERPARIRWERSGI